MTKRNKPKLLDFTVRQIENGYTLITREYPNKEHYDYIEKTNVFLTANALIEFIEKLV